MVAEEKYCVQAKPFRALMNLIIAWRKTGEIIRQSHSIGDTKPHGEKRAKSYANHTA